MPFALATTATAIGVCFLALVPVARAQTQKPVVIHTVDYFKPPSTLAGLWASADAVVRGRVDSGRVQALPSGEECVLFLEWNPGTEHFEIAYGPDGTFLLRNGIIETPARNDPGRRLQHTPAAAFLSLVRALQ